MLLVPGAILRPQLATTTAWSANQGGPRGTMGATFLANSTSTPLGEARGSRLARLLLKLNHAFAHS
eukprot:9799680-Lingulodinium_polyedra.AAC.1